MGLIARAYSPLLVNGEIIQASNVVRALDDIYDTVNGNLDSANLKTSLILNVSRIVVNDTATTFSGSDVMQNFTELKMKGFNTVHVAGFGTAGFSVFPGIVENRGLFGRVNGRINFSSSDSVVSVPSGANYLSAGFLFSGAKYAVMFKRAAVITASDIYLTRLSNLSASLGMSNPDLNGYYSLNSQDRAISTVYQGYSASQNLWDLEMFQRPFGGHVYSLSNNEMCASGFLNIGTRVSTVLRIFDFNTNLYYYRLQGRIDADTAVGITLFNDLNEFSVFSSVQAGNTGLGFDFLFYKDFTLHQRTAALSIRSFQGDSDRVYDNTGCQVARLDWVGNDLGITVFNTSVTGTKFALSLYRNPIANRITI